MLQFLVAWLLVTVEVADAERKTPALPGTMIEAVGHPYTLV